MSQTLRPTPEELALRRAEVEDFRRRWFRLVRQWRGALRRGVEAADEVLWRALADGLPADEPGRVPVPPVEAQKAAEQAVLARSELFEADEYAYQHRIVRRMDPARHFVETGWRDLRAPSLDVDLWHCWTEYLDPTDDAVDPLLHHLLVGRHRGDRPLPAAVALRPGATYDEGYVPRRVCLFAGYDPDGLVDDYVVDYLRELSRFADVYYLADGVLEPGQLERLADVTVAAWAVPHRAYDFGSVSMLARELVGWDVLDQYDEVVVANDSCFLLRPLDDVFARMDRRACDWWSLQATSMEHDESYLRDDSPVRLAEAKRRFVGPRHWTDVRSLHLSSYFLVFRRPVVADPGFRWRLDTVVPQREKMMVVHKYEVGLSRYLLSAGFDFDTFLDDLHAFHPLYSRHFLDLVERGFPLVKRNYLGENPRHVQGLERWPEMIRALVPDAPVDLMRANIERVTPYARRVEAFSVTEDPDTGWRVVPLGPVRGNTFRRLDRETPDHPHWWAFPLSIRTGRLDPGLRAVFEQVRDDPTIHKVVLARGRAVADDLDGPSVDVLALDTTAGQAALVRCGVVLVDDAPDVTLPVPLAQGRHRFVHVGHGLPLVAARLARPVAGEWRKLRGLAVSSDLEALSRSSVHPEIGLDVAWATGLPRHDHLVGGPADLPADLRSAEERLRDRLDGRPLVVWWTDGTLAPPDADTVRRLGAWADATGVVLGVREGVVDRPDGWTRALAPLAPLGLSDRSVASPVPLLRVAAAVVTDGAPASLDAAVLGTPVILVDDVLDQDAPPWAQTVVEVDHWPAVHPVIDHGAALAALADLAEQGSPRRVLATGPGVAPLDGGAAARVVARVRALMGS